VQGQAAVADTRDVDGRATRDAAYSTAVNRDTRNLNYQLNYDDIGPGFRTALGFVPRTDIRQPTQFVSYRWRPKKGRVTSFGPNSFVQGTWDHTGQLQDWTIRFPFELQMKRQSGLFTRHAEMMERFAGIEFREYENLLAVFTSYFRWMDFNFFTASGTRPNFFPPAGITPFLAKFRDAQVSVTFRPLSALALDETYIYSHLGAREGSGYRGTIFDNHIVRSRVNYQFTREFSLRAIVDYNGVLANSSLVALARTKHFNTDLLFTYLLNPGTALYVGYTDGYDNVALDPLRGISPIRTPTTSTGRQVFVKTSYLFRF
jgi:hypothetical protein